MVVHHSSPSSAEAQAIKEKYEAQGFEVFVFDPLRPRCFAGWSVEAMLSECDKLQYFVQRAKALSFSGQARLHAKLELATLADVLESLIPKNPFNGLPIVAKGFLTRTFYVLPTQTD